MTDTVMHEGEHHVIERGELLRVQTPQAFATAALLAAHERARAEGFVATDDFQLVRRNGGTTAHVLGSEFTRKITTREDIAIAEALAASGALKDFV
jgi:2-C-methyl-D-erythritol 4-phosphate cytidylyltransferase